MVYTLPFRPLKTFPDLGGRWGGNPQKSSPESEGDTSAGPAGPVPTTTLQEVPTTFLRRDAGPRRLPLPHPHRQGISQAAGSGKTGTRAPGRLHLALRAPRTRSGAALASRFGPAAKGPSSGGPALARPLLPKHLGSSHHPDPPQHHRLQPPAPPARPQVFTFRPAPHAFAASAGPCGCGGAGGRGWSRRRGGAATLPTPGSPPRPAPPGPAPPRPHFRDRPWRSAGPASRPAIGSKLPEVPPRHVKLALATPRAAD